MTHGHAAELRAGLERQTPDHKKIGTVKRIAEHALAVDAPLELDYWLPLSSVAALGAELAQLTFAWEEVGVYKTPSADDIAGTAAAEESSQSGNPDAPRPPT